MSEHQGEESSPAFVHKKSLGQNFLTSEVVPRWLCDAALLNPDETVLEIGPGTGRLTKELLARGARVYAIEADLRAVSILQETFASKLSSGQLNLHHGDVRTLSVSALGFKNGGFSVVANIPYYLSGFLLRRLLEAEILPRTLVFLMQKEMVERIAREEKSSLLSLSVRAFGDPFYIKTVSRGHFHPAPKVDSAILAVRNISRERLLEVPPDFFFSILHLGLGSKRKQLIGNLSQNYPRERLTQIFTNLTIPLTIRGEDLSLSTWVTLAKALLR